MENSGEVFTANDAWKGGYYNLLLCPLTSSAEVTCSVLETLWTLPSLDGCYLRRDLEPSVQTRVRPCEQRMAGHLFGTMTLPNRRMVPCGSYTTETPKGGKDVFRWVGFYLPLGALSKVYPIGAYPFGGLEKVSDWKPMLDDLLLEITKEINSKVPISVAVVGFEVNRLSDSSPDKIRANGIPTERSDGVLWNVGGDLRWYPATRP